MGILWESPEFHNQATKGVREQRKDRFWLALVQAFRQVEKSIVVQVIARRDGSNSFSSPTRVTTPISNPTARRNGYVPCLANRVVVAHKRCRDPVGRKRTDRCHLSSPVSSIMASSQAFSGQGLDLCWCSKTEVTARLLPKVCTQPTLGHAFHAGGATCPAPYDK